MASYDPFPNSEFMMQFRTHALEEGKYPPPEDCIMDMVKAQLQVVMGLLGFKFLWFCNGYLSDREFQYCLLLSLDRMSIYNSFCW